MIKENDIVVVKGHYLLENRGYTKVGMKLEMEHLDRYYPIGMISIIVDAGDGFGLRVVGLQGGWRAISGDVIVGKATKKERFIYRIKGRHILEKEMEKWIEKLDRIMNKFKVIINKDNTVLFLDKETKGCQKKIKRSLEGTGFKAMFISKGVSSKLFLMRWEKGRQTLAEEDFKEKWIEL